MLEARSAALQKTYGIPVLVVPAVFMGPLLIRALCSSLKYFLHSTSHYIL